MTWSKKLRNPFVQQYAIEIVFPLIGYFFFDWDILIIATYYLIDHLCSQIMFFRRALWVKNKGEVKYGSSLFIIAILTFLLFFIAEIALLENYIRITQHFSIEKMNELFLEFAKNELWFLFPLVLFMYHFKDQFTFYMPRHYLKYNYKKYLIWDMVNSSVVLVLLAAIGYVWVLTMLPNVVAILIFVTVKIGFDLSIKQFIQKKSFSSATK